MSKGMRGFQASIRESLVGILGTIWCVSVLWSVSVGLGHLLSPEVPAEISISASSGGPNQISTEA